MAYKYYEYRGTWYRQSLCKKEWWYVSHDQGDSWHGISGKPALRNMFGEPQDEIHPSEKLPS